ncbi:alpha/beta hydrolase [Lentzea sp. NBRC 105346]|uniref:alpha/beta fold hydrolase n=1 Tax=Lentzea sp. NBRC 105346 TaxID=3032205 RepID=UPI0024A5E948|nr:alpha/beta hydrolase [Lentzea sp. NBRC 105346]GLZ30043.1 alpha/beta hydrolase [Lentzea sp. NBRC 105346]
MSTVVSPDGTAVGYTKIGTGPALILVDGAMCYRDFGPMKELAEALAPHFTVYYYDRRGRGETGGEWSLEHEVEDIETLVKDAGGTAYVFGASSGGALALDAACRVPGITKVAVYEPPFIIDDTHPARPDDYIDKMDAMIAAGRRGDAVQTFMKTVGAPGFAIAVMKLTPVWKKLKAVAHTLPNDLRIMGDTGSGKPLPTDRWAGATMPALAIDGGKSPVYMRNGVRSLSEILPDAEYRTLDGQTHMVKAAVVAPVLVEFFTRN